MSKNIYLTGFMGCGKTTAGKALAARLNADFADTDARLEEGFGRSIAEFVAKRGMQAFRDEETKLLRALSGLNNTVISTGGGALLEKENQALIGESGVIIFIDTPFAVCKKRIATAQKFGIIRPLAAQKSAAELKNLYDERRVKYLLAASLTVDGKRPAAAVAKQIEKLISQKP